MTERLSSEQILKIKSLEENYKIITENIQNAIQNSGTGLKDVRLLAATKTVEPYLINHAIKLGIRYIGENRVQELLSKYDSLDLDSVSAHFIGHLQTNKVKQIVTKVDMIQSVDSLKLAKEISKQATLKGKNMDVLVEVNVGREESKSGVFAEDIEGLLEQIAQLDGISVRGLMAIPPICENKTQVKKYFSKIYELFIDIHDKNMDNISMDFISMGMSSDYVEAIECGANVVRIGSALFGNRMYK